MSIALFTDFSNTDAYVGQIHARLAGLAPGVPVIDLFHNAPNFNIQAAAYLLPAYTQYLHKGAICLCVVDPGVGGKRDAVIVHAAGRWYVGPDNGMFSMACRYAKHHRSWRINWQLADMSATFHGRDLFAPVTALLANGWMPQAEKAEITLYPDWPDDYHGIIYIDHYNNMVTGMRCHTLSKKDVLEINGHQLGYAQTFSEAPEKALFWYGNANGLIEIAANQGHAAIITQAAVGQKINIMRK